MSVRVLLCCGVYIHPTAKPRSAQTEVQVCAIGADVEPAIRKIRFRKAKDNAALIRAP
jgi:hypothetical protein